jgi:hypothetical protein
MSESHTGKIISEETRQKISEALSGENHPMFGKSHSAESLEKMSESQRSIDRTGENNPMFGKTGENNPMKKKCICLFIQFRN